MFTHRTRPARAGYLACAAAAVMVSAACGSTVPSERMQNGEAAPAADGLTAPATAGAQPASGALGAATGVDSVAGGRGQRGRSGSSQVAGDGGMSATGTAGAAGPAPTARTRRGTVPGRGPGVTATAVRVGLIYIDNAGAGVNELGVNGYSQGDEVGEFRALVADLNRRGGTAGRKVEVVPHDCGQGCTTGDPSALDAACRYFAEDSPVLLVVSSMGYSGPLADCLAKRQIGFVVSSGGPPDRMMRNRPIYVPDDISLERYARLLVDALGTAGWFRAGSKIGIVRPDDPEYARVTKNVLRPALAAAHADVVTEEATTGTDASGIVLRLKGKGVTHVVTYGTPLFMMTAAETQQYRPWWSISSMVGPGAFLQGSAPREQLKKTAGPGWQAGADVDAAHQPPASRAQTRCLDTLKKAGFAPTGTPRAVALLMCGSLAYFEQVMSRVPEVSTPGFLTGAASAPSYESPITFRLDFAGGRHDGAASYRLNRFDDACGCYQYVGPLLPIR